MEAARQPGTKALIMRLRQRDVRALKSRRPLQDCKDITAHDGAVHCMPSLRVGCFEHYI